MRDMHIVIEDLYRVFGNVQHLLSSWTGESTDNLVAELLKLDPLEAELSEFVGNAEHAHLIKMSVYTTVFKHGGIHTE